MLFIIKISEQSKKRLPLILTRKFMAHSPKCLPTLIHGDGGTGATDNGTGTLTMMEAMRLLKKFYPHPKRTILVGHWASEEEGLNGSRAFVEDHPEIVKNLQALFNQDNGTGRVIILNGAGFADAKDYLPQWLAAVPDTIKNRIKTNFPGSPDGGGSDFASFDAVGAPGFSLGSLNWHTVPIPGILTVIRMINLYSTR